MKRISLSLSDALHRKMQKFKGDINYSQVARTAIAKEIRKYELWADPAKDLAELIEKFRKQKEVLMNKWEKEGFECGQDWVKSAEFVEVEGFVKNLPENLQDGQPWSDIEGAVDYVANYEGDPEWTDTAAKSFWFGFNKGVKTLWEEISNQL